MASLDYLQSEIAAIVDQDSDTANLSTDDYTLRTSYLNRALNEWAELTDWPTLYREYNSLVSTSAGNASISLPSNFRKLANFPLINQSNSTDQYPEVDPVQDQQFGDTDKRCQILGSPRTGYVLRIFGTTLASGASIKVPYYASPQSLVTTTDIADIPNPEYLVQRAVAYIWEGREDPRFPQARAEANRILSNMLERENTPNRASYWDSVRSVEETRANFKWGRDS